MHRSRRQRGLTVPEAARLIQFHQETVRYWLQVGELRGFRQSPGDDWLIEPEDLLAFFRENGEIPPWSVPGDAAADVVARSARAG